MRILHQACVTTSLDGADLWQTERRSSDWNVGDAPRDQVDPRQLALAPVEPSRRASGIPNPVVAGLLMHRPIADLRASDSGSQRVTSLGTRDAGRRPLA